MPTPLPIEKMVVSQSSAGICLVDHQQMSQVNPAIDPERIVGVIDHHALQNATIVTDRAIYIVRQTLPPRHLYHLLPASCLEHVYSSSPSTLFPLLNRISGLGVA